MKWFRLAICLLVFLVFSCLLSLNTSADELDEWYHEQAEASGADTLSDLLPEETQELLRSIGLSDFSFETPKAYTDFEPTKLFKVMENVFAGQIGTVLPACGLLLCIVLLCAIAEGFKHTVEDAKMSEIFSTICAVSACVVLLLPVLECIKQVKEAAEGVSVFMLSFIPAYAALIFAGGQAKLASVYTSVLFSAAQVTRSLVTNVVFPVTTVSLGIGSVGVLAPKSRLNRLCETLSKFSGWLLGTVTALFTALFSLQGVVASAADSIGLRTARMSIGTFVPIVGGALGEALGAVSGCLNMLRSTLGMFGVAAMALLLLPSLCRTVAWAVALHFCGLICDMFDVAAVSSMIRMVHGVVKTMVAVLAVCAMISIVSTTLVTMVGGGVAWNG